MPADIRDRVAGLKLDVPVGDQTVRLVLKPDSQHVRLSLRTADPLEVKVRLKAVDGYLDAVWAALRTGRPITLSHIQATALAGEVYRAWTDVSKRERTTAVELTAAGEWVRAEVSDAEELAYWTAAAQMVSVLSSIDDADEDRAILEEAFGPIVNRLLSDKGIACVDRRSRDTILLATGRALRDAFQRRQANAEGDYSPDANAKRFPRWQAPHTNGEQGEASAYERSVLLSTLLDEWWTEAKAAGRGVSTYESYRNTVRRLILHLGHEDASRITTADVIAFKDARLAAGLSPKTVKDSDVAGLKSIFRRAVQNGRLKDNPAASVTVLRVTPVQLRSKSFTLAEATTILRHALAYRGSRSEASKTTAAKRWLPWLCAYTGARLGEVAQLRKRDVREEGGLYIVTITPEAGTVKDKRAREVVLHEHLIELGFMSFVAGAAPGHLFLNGGEGEDLRGAWRALKNRLREFVRQVVKDENVAPNHAWRHLFKTIGREHGIEDRVMDAIQGHAPPNIGGRYGEVTLQAEARAMRQFPRFEI